MIADKSLSVKDIQNSISEKTQTNNPTPFRLPYESSNFPWCGTQKESIQMGWAGLTLSFNELSIEYQILHWIEERYNIEADDKETVLRFVKVNDLQTQLITLPQIIYSYFTPPDEFPFVLKLIHDYETDEDTLFLFIRTEHEVAESMNKLWDLDKDPQLCKIFGDNQRILIDVMFE